MRLPTICLSLALLAGCAGEPLPESSPPGAVELATATPAAVALIPAGPRLADHRYITADGTSLPLRVFLPEGRPKAVILGLHGMNDYSNAFTLPAPELTRQGIALYAYDQRGFGAGPRRGRWAGADVMVDDAARAAWLLRQRYPDTPIYLLGESMGGAIAILVAARPSPPPIDGIVLVAPAVWGRQTMNFFERAGLWFTGLFPAMKLSADALPVKIRASDNVPMLRALGADPLVIKDTRSDTLNGVVDLMGAALIAAPRLVTPALILYGENDQVVPRAPMARFVATLPPAARARQRIALYPSGYHMLMRDIEAKIVIDDVAAWMLHPSDPLPSRADRGARMALTGEPEIIAAERTGLRD
ncbi:MAG TPA: alpha/beta hydrolase [Stellaceae bacterium]|nr:alpha/beta hydrolase [Stellaceae bacterium]